jgi:hypothetical protein
VPRRILVAALLAALLPRPGPAQTLGTDYWQQYVHYDIACTLDVDDHRLKASQFLLYRNQSPDTLDRFYLHLYPNAFRDRDTPLARSWFKGNNWNLLWMPEEYRGWLRVDTLLVASPRPIPPESEAPPAPEGETGGSGTAPSLSLVPNPAASDRPGRSDMREPGPGSFPGLRRLDFTVDNTILEAELPEPLLPGEEILIRMAWKEKVRRKTGRAGYEGTHFDVAQWYPKMVVYDQDGWHPDEFEQGEFYGEFGTFDVRITLPSRFVIAATGTPVAGDPGWKKNLPGADKPDSEDGGSKTVHFRAEQVHDFAWCADPTFVVQDTTWNGVRIMSVYRSFHRSWEDSNLAYAVRAMKWLDEKVGPYPYPQVSVVDVAGGGGMEYPMLVMDARCQEGLVLHEVGHIYFYGILANDERAEAWLDEGMTSFQTAWYLEERYGPKGRGERLNWYRRWLPRPGIWEDDRADYFGYVRRGYDERIETRAEDFEHSYRLGVYTKASVVMDALRYVLGEELFEKVLREYYSRWGLKHVNGERFQQVCEQMSGQDLDWFFQEWIYARKACDYRLDEVSTREEGGRWISDVKIKREDDIIMPIELVVETKGGEEERIRLDGIDRSIQTNVTTDTEPRRFALNPENKILDHDFSDNFQPRRRRFYLDWPNWSYHPQDAVTYRVRPSAWYNDVDGIRTGLLVRRDRYGVFSNTRLGLTYGTRSERVNGEIGFETPLSFFLTGPRTRVGLWYKKLEGRRTGGIYIHKIRHPRLAYPTRQEIDVAWTYHELRDLRYLPDPSGYDDTILGRYRLAYTIYPQADLFTMRARAALEGGKKLLGGSDGYDKLILEGVLKAGSRYLPLSVNLRLFAGFASGGVPRQERYGLAGAGALAREEKSYLRSDGGLYLHDDVNYHMGGDGNLRGYLASGLAAKDLVAANVEIERRMPLVGKLLGPLGKVISSPSLALFLDAGKIYGDLHMVTLDDPRLESLAARELVDRPLWDAGVGFRSASRLPFLDFDLRLDLPLFVNTPELNPLDENGEREERWKLRWLVSVERPF